MHFGGAMTFLFLLCLAMSVLELASSMGGVLYGACKVSKSRAFLGALQTSSRIVPTSAIRSPHICFNSCSELQWCQLWCLDLNSNNTCLFFNLYILHYYQETNLTDAMDCYVKKKKPDLTFGATVTGPRADPLTPKRVKENIMDGIYNLQKNECYRLNKWFNPYFKVDLGSIKPVQWVMVLLQNNSYAQYVYNIEVLIGREDLPESNFKDYKLFGYFPGPSQSGQQIIFNYPYPIMARYLVFRRLSNKSVCSPNTDVIEEVCMLQLCHLEIS